MGIAGPSRREQARVAARVRELVGERPAPGGSHRRDDPEDAPRARWEPSRKAVAGAAVLVVAVIVATIWWYATAQAPAVPVVGSEPTAASTPRVGGSSGSPAPAGGSAAASVVVDVAGKVAHPGVYTLAPGARVVDALRAAGGVSPGVSTVSLNLAAVLHDGDKVVVGVPGAAGAGAAGSGGVSSQLSGLVNLNSATLEQLDGLPGVGPVLAQHILDWRNAHGSFTSVDQLNGVSGIGDSKFADLKSLVTV